MQRGRGKQWGGGLFILFFGCLVPDDNSALGDWRGGYSEIWAAGFGVVADCVFIRNWMHLDGQPGAASDAMRGVWEGILGEEEEDDGFWGGTRNRRFATRRTAWDIFEGVEVEAAPIHGGLSGRRRLIYHWERGMASVCLGRIGAVVAGDIDGYRSHRFGTGREGREEEFIWLVLFLLHIYLSDLCSMKR